MNDQETRPDVSSLLQALREHVGQVGDEVRFYDTGLVRRISDSVSTLQALPRARPDVPSLLQALREQADHVAGQVRFHDVGTVQNIGNGVATLSGLPRARTDELVTFPTGVQGLILNLNHDRIDVILLGPEEGIQGGDLVTATGERLRVPVGQRLLGRVVNPLGEPLDERGPVEAGGFHYLEREAPGIVERAPVDEPLHTGVKIVDALIPIGRGQRELIVGDRQTGKTTLAVDTILNQRDSGVLCVYVAIGQKKSTTLANIETLRQEGALPYTIVVVSSPDDPPALRYLAPYAGCTMAEFLMHRGRDVLIVYDDLSKHADTCRELSLLLRRPPGREAYPGDIFYLHARLLERACKLAPPSSPPMGGRKGGTSPPPGGREGGTSAPLGGSLPTSAPLGGSLPTSPPLEGSPPSSPPLGGKEGGKGGGSLTALPIVEMQRGNIAAYIPTNLISITDGQIVLDAELFNRGVKPAVNVGKSVSRVGGAAQTAAIRAVAGKLRLELSQFEEVARFARFGTEVDEATRRQIQRGERLRAVLTQPAHQPLPLAAQVTVLLAAIEGYLDDVALEDVPAFERGLQARLEAAHPEISQHINHSGELIAENREALTEMMTSCRTARIEGRVPSAAEESGTEGGREQ
jgi:F-type H+-transporting ATPase subunit alpha